MAAARIGAGGQFGARAWTPHWLPLWLCRTVIENVQSWIDPKLILEKRLGVAVRQQLDPANVGRGQVIRTDGKDTLSERRQYYW